MPRLHHCILLLLLGALQSLPLTVLGENVSNGSEPGITVLCRGNLSSLSHALESHSLTVLLNKSLSIPQDVSVACGLQIGSSEVLLKLSNVTLARLALDKSAESVALISSSLVKITSTRSNVSALTTPCTGFMMGREYLTVGFSLDRTPDRIRLVAVQNGNIVVEKTYPQELLKYAFKGGSIAIPPAECSSFPLELPSTHNAIVVIVDWGLWQDAILILPPVTPQVRGEVPESNGTSTSIVNRRENATVILPPVSTLGEAEGLKSLHRSNVKYALFIILGLLLFALTYRISKRR